MQQEPRRVPLRRNSVMVLVGWQRAERFKKIAALAGGLESREETPDGGDVLLRGYRYITP